MRDYTYSKKDNVARTVANTVAFAGAGTLMWLLLIGADRLMGIIGII